MSTRYDLILYGATGFTGQLVAEHLLDRYGVGGELHWAMAGRSREKLEAVRRALQGHGKAEPIPLVEADSADGDSLRALAESSKVICSTVGPYARYGSELVAACAEVGTDYCDLTGEVPWIAAMIDAHQATAEESGARIIHCCGFDSIPSDLGTWFLQQATVERFGRPAQRVRGRVGKTRGAASGGTVASLMGVMEDAAGDPTLRRSLQNKYLLYPAGEAPGPEATDQRGPRYDERFEQWTAPFVMAAINERVVHRSNALQDFSWGRDFIYDESLLCANRPQALTISMAMGAGVLTASTALGRKAMGRLLPSPGEGPDRHARESGFFELFFEGERADAPDESLRVRVYGDRDPGYGATSRMLGEAASCLALNECNVDGGIWTPASALAAALIPRLQEHAGMSFTLMDDS